MVDLAKYHPLRFAQTRTYAKRAVSALQSMPGMESGIPTHEAFQAVGRLVQDGYNEALEDIPFEDRPLGTQLAMKEISYTLTYAMFCKSGRNIFDIDAALVEMFHHTEVGDIPLSTIQTPFDNLYLHFGPQDNLSMFGGEYVVEGAYVVFRTELLQVWLATRRVDGQRPHIVSVPDRYYYLPIPLDSENLTVGEALSLAIENEVKAQEPSEGWQEAFATVASEAREQGIHLTSNRERSSEQAKAEVIEGSETFLSAMNLVLNSLCYLTAYQEDIQADWPDDAPASLKEKADHGKTPKERRRAESKLLPMGFTKVRFCRAAQGGNSQNEFATDSPSVRAHWRRGHWRNQPMGPRDKRTHQLRWIRPTYVGKGEAKAISGHLYSVNKPTD